METYFDDTSLTSVTIRAIGGVVRTADPLIDFKID